MTLPLELRQLPWWRQPSMASLVVLALSLVLYPFADSVAGVRPIAQLLDITVVLMVVRLVRKQVDWLRSGWILGVPLVVLQLAHLLWPAVPGVEMTMLLAQIAFHGYAVLVLLAYVLRDEVVTLDELFAIACVYVLMALLWASAFALVVHFDPHAIFINPTNDLDGRTTWADLVYFSMTTLTSTGYGEITPVSPPARALAMLLQLFGVLFVAILIARLTGLYALRRSG
jgi:hypothetical protein